MKISCTIIRKDEDLRKPLGHWFEIVEKALGFLDVDSEFPESESLKLLAEFSKDRSFEFVKESLANYDFNPDKIRVRYRSRPIAHIGSTSREIAVPRCPIFIGRSLIASKPISKVYSLPLLN